MVVMHILRHIDVERCPMVFVGIEEEFPCPRVFEGCELINVATAVNNALVFGTNRLLRFEGSCVNVLRSVRKACAVEAASIDSERKPHQLPTLQASPTPLAIQLQLGFLHCAHFSTTSTVGSSTNDSSTKFNDGL